MMLDTNEYVDYHYEIDIYYEKIARDFHQSMLAHRRRRQMYVSLFSLFMSAKGPFFSLVCVPL